MADQLLRLIITANSTQAERDLRKVQKKLRDVGGTMSTVGTNMTKMGVALGVGLVYAAKKAGEAEVAQARLLNTLKNAKSTNDVSVKAFVEQSKAIQKLTAADDEAVLSIQALLGQFGMTGKSVLKFTPLVVDAARKMGKDYPAVAKAIGKALGKNGTAGALSKLGITVDKTAYKHNKYKAVMDALKKSVGGFGKDELKTLPGAMQNLQNRFDDFMENGGKPLTEAFADLAREAGDFLDTLSTWMEKNPEATKGIVDALTKIAGFLLVGGPLLKGLGTMVTLLGKSRGATKSLLGVFGSLTKEVSSAGALNTGIGVIGAALAGWTIGNLIAEIPVVKDALTRFGEYLQRQYGIGGSGNGTAELGSAFSSGNNWGYINDDGTITYGSGSTTHKTQAKRSKAKPARKRAYALGGIASGPESGYAATLHGTEAVLPLNNPRRYAEVLSQANAAMGMATTSGPTYNITVHADSMSDRRAIAAAVMDVLSSATRRSGALRTGGAYA